MGQVVAQDVVADDMVEAPAEGVELGERRFQRALTVHHGTGCASDRRKGEKLDRRRINFEVYRNARRQAVRSKSLSARIHPLEQEPL